MLQDATAKGSSAALETQSFLPPVSLSLQDLLASNCHMLQDQQGLSSNHLDC